MNAKVVVALLLLIALLFAVLAFRGDQGSQRSASGRVNIDPDTLRVLKRFDAAFGPKRTTLDAVRLGNQCELRERAFVVAGNGSCEVLVAPGADEIAFLVLRLVWGVGAEIGYEPSNPPEDAEAPDPESVDTGKTLRIPIESGGGTLSMTCRGTTACRILLVD